MLMASYGAERVKVINYYGDGGTKFKKRKKKKKKNLEIQLYT